MQVKLKDIQTYLIQKNIKENLGDEVEIIQDKVVVKDNNKVYFEGCISEYGDMYSYYGQLSLLSDVFRKKKKATILYNSSNEIGSEWEDLELEEHNLEFDWKGTSKLGHELIYGAYLGYEDNKMIIRADGIDVFYEKIDRIKAGLERIDRDNHLCVFFIANEIFVSKGFKKEEMKIYYLEDDEVKAESVNFFYTKCTCDKIEKAKRIIQKEL